jgi:hypothetical protein
MSGRHDVVGPKFALALGFVAIGCPPLAAAGIYAGTPMTRLAPRS